MPAGGIDELRTGLKPRFMLRQIKAWSLMLHSGIPNSNGIRAGRGRHLLERQYGWCNRWSLPIHCPESSVIHLSQDLEDYLWELSDNILDHTSLLSIPAHCPPYPRRHKGWRPQYIIPPHKYHPDHSQCAAIRKLVKHFPRDKFVILSRGLLFPIRLRWVVFALPTDNKHWPCSSRRRLPGNY